MKKLGPANLDAARRLLAREALENDGGAEERAAAARRAHQKIVAFLGALVGLSAAHALFARSVKLAAPDFPPLGRLHLAVQRGEEMGEQIEVCMRGETPDVVLESTVTLFATLLALLGKLIGEPLTAKVLRDSSPALPAVRVAPEEEEKKK